MFQIAGDKDPEVNKRASKNAQKPMHGLFLENQSKVGHNILILFFIVWK